MNTNSFHQHCMDYFSPNPPKMARLNNLPKVMTNVGQNLWLLHNKNIYLSAQQLTIASTQELFKCFLNEWMRSCFPLRLDSQGPIPSSIAYCVNWNIKLFWVIVSSSVKSRQLLWRKHEGRHKLARWPEEMVSVLTSPFRLTRLLFKWLLGRAFLVSLFVLSIA